jgi:cellulose synthase/poly-beta-1,6-N-acetylglucosamine synthase-like glycosyltransferase
MAKTEGQPVLGSSATIIKSEAEKKAAISGKSEKQVFEEMLYSVNMIKMWVMIIAIAVLSSILINLIFSIVTAVQLTRLK